MLVHVSLHCLNLQQSSKKEQLAGCDQKPGDAVKTAPWADDNYAETKNGNNE